MTACGTPAWETPFDTVEEFEATAKAKARKGGRGKKDELKAASSLTRKSMASASEPSSAL